MLLHLLPQFLCFAPVFERLCLGLQCLLLTRVICTQLFLMLRLLYLTWLVSSLGPAGSSPSFTRTISQPVHDGPTQGSPNVSATAHGDPDVGFPRSRFEFDF